MAYSKRIPPVKIKLSNIDFNKFIEILTIQAESEDENISKKSIKLKDKLLRYSVPIKTEEDEILVDIRCYQNEIVDMFYIIFDGLKEDVDYETDYFEVLLKVRESIKQQNQENE